MRKSALLFTAAVFAVALPGVALAQAKDPNANTKKFLGDWVSQIFVPGQSLAKGATVAPAKAVKPAKKAKKAKKAAKPKAEQKKS